MPAAAFTLYDGMPPLLMLSYEGVNFQVFTTNEGKLVNLGNRYLYGGAL